MTRKGLFDSDVGFEGFVLRQLADGHRAAPGKIVDGRQVSRADAMGNSAYVRISGDAAVEYRLTGCAIVADLAHKLDADLDRIAAILAPNVVALADFIDKADRARFRQTDGYHLADSPEPGNRSVSRIGEGCDFCTGPIALYDVAKYARAVPALLRRWLRAPTLPLDKHAGTPIFPEQER